LDHQMSIEDVLSGATRWHIEQGDSAIVAKTIPDCSIDAICADPPSGINFMQKSWDSDRGGKEHWVEWLAGILREGYRVLKPGGHMVLWALPRTSHWTAEAGERAGFDLREKILHAFGSGFPKSLNVAKAIGDGPEAAKWIGHGTALKPAVEEWLLFRKPLDGTVAANVLRHGTGALNIDAARVGTGDSYNRAPASSGYSGIAGYEKGTGRMPESSSLGRFPANLVLSHTAWEETHCPCGAVLSFVARFCPECGSGDVEHRRCGCREVGERKIPGAVTQEVKGTRPGGFGNVGAERGASRPNGPGYADPDGLETVTAWECLATCGCGLSTLAPSGGSPPRCRCGRAMTWACAVARLDEQSGETVSGSRAAGVRTGIGYGSSAQVDGGPAIEGNEGGASRVFNTFAPPDDIEPFFYCAKPSAAEAEAGCERLPVKRAHENVDREEGSAGLNSPRTGAGRLSGRRNHHPTRKSIALMRHFVRLVCPPGGIVLDMFAGSGTTIASAALEGFRAIGIEMGAEYVPIGRARVAFWAALAGTQAAAEGTPKPKRDAGDERQGRLF